MASGGDDNRDAATEQVEGFARLFHSPEFEAKTAMAMGSDAVMALLNRRAARTVELEAVVSEQTAALEELGEALERLHLERDQERSRLTSEQQRLTEERDRLAAELRANRRASGELPRTARDLRRWREERGLTQVEAAKMLGVGHATVERAEGTAAVELLLGRGLRTALERDAAATRVAQAGPRVLAGARKDPGQRAR
jgi:hypothetical protein